MSGPLSPYFGILRRPSGTALALAEENRGQIQSAVNFCLLAFLIPMPTLVQVDEAGFSLNLSLVPQLLILSLAGGALFCVLMSWLFRNFSRMLGGKATIREIRIGMGWGLLPSVISIAVFVLFWCIFLHFAYEPAPQGMEPNVRYMSLVGPFLFVFVVCMMYSTGVLLLALSGVARLSLMKAFFALVITLAVSVFPLTFVLQLVMGVN